MAKKRMFSCDVVNSDNFLNMSCTARCLYFHLGLVADDDGILNSVMSIIRLVQASFDDMKLLIDKSYVLPLCNDCYAITHWRQNNYLRGDRYTESVHTKAKAMLFLDESNCYHLKSELDESKKISGYINGIPVVYLEEKILEKKKKDKISIDKNSIVSCDEVNASENKTLIPGINPNLKEYFDSFVNIYPKKTYICQVITWFNKTKPSDELMKEVMDSLNRFINSEDWADIRYVPNPYDWLANNRWMDKPISPRVSTGDMDVL